MIQQMQAPPRKRWRDGLSKWFVVAAVAVLAAATLTVVNPTPASAETNVAGGYVRSPQTWYTYVKAGETYQSTFTYAGSASNVVGAVNPTIQVVGPAGTTLSTCTNIVNNSTAGTTCNYSTTALNTGVYSVSLIGDLTAGNNSTFMTWNIGAKTAGGVANSGRTWSEEFKMYDYVSTTIAIPVPSLPLWYVTEQGYQYQVERTGINGVDSTYRANAFGNVDVNTCTSAYRSVATRIPPNLNPQYVPLDQSTCKPSVFKLFFEKPALDLPLTATLPNGTTTWVNPLTVGPISAPAITFAQDAPGSRSGKVGYTINNFEGTAALQVDVDNDGIFNGPKDRSIPVQVIDGVAATMHFDGLDASGVVIPVTTPIAFRLAFDRIAEVHFNDLDIEMLTGGIKVTRVDSGLNQASKIYWDDSHLPTDDAQNPYKCSTMTSPLNNLSGTTSGTLHSWDLGACQLDKNLPKFFNPGNTVTDLGGTYGNNRSIDNWTYVASDYYDSIDVPGYKLTKTAVPATGTTVASGDVINYTVSVSPIPYAALAQIKTKATAWSARVADDLTKVRDDAGAALTDLLATPAAQSTLEKTTAGWTWTGLNMPLSTTATIKYSATVKATNTGDGSVYNIAYASPTNVGPVVPTTCVVNLCGETTHTLIPPSWSVKKTSSVGGNPAVTKVVVGDIIDYTVTATSTERDISGVVLTDTLTDVLDDSTFVPGSAKLTIGAAAPIAVADPVNGVLVSPAFTLPAGKVATLNYKVTVKAGVFGATLRNVVVGASTTIPPTTCAVGAPANPTVCETVHTRTTPLQFKKIGESGSNGWVAMDGSEWAIYSDVAGVKGTLLPTMVVTPMAGQTGMFQLAEATVGTYWLVETKAPATFNLLAEGVQFTVSGTGVVTLGQGSGGGTVTAGNGTVLGVSMLTVRDVPALKLPASGGSGRVAFTTGGIVLLALAGGLWFITDRRKRRTE